MKIDVETFWSGLTSYEAEIGIEETGILTLK